LVQPLFELVGSETGERIANAVALVDGEFHTMTRGSIITLGSVRR
jgi:hypothetical protein